MFIVPILSLPLSLENTFLKRLFSFKVMSRKAVLKTTEKGRYYFYLIL
jgi:hypothetical protein